MASARRERVEDEFQRICRSSLIEALVSQCCLGGRLGMLGRHQEQTGVCMDLSVVLGVLCGRK